MPEKSDSTDVLAARKRPERGSVLEVIEQGRWSRALFTSFTLSLTHFESYVWPRLRRSGCEQVDILVDRRGFADSLMERHARGVGREYVPTPVAMRGGGIFHPKLVYLWGQEGPRSDLLLVGSGNLTFPGHGGNLEVLEILGPSHHADAFGQAAEFFASLGTSPAIDVADTQPLSECATRCASAAADGETLERARFIHCLEEPGIEQFEAAARRFVDLGTEWDSLLVLSPFHHPKATPVLRLLNAFGITRLKVGVPSRENEASSFPFPEAAQWPGIQMECVAPVAERAESRALHAKWLELQGPSGALVLSGSFNATEESLCLTKNVECGVLRELGVASDGWVGAPQPAYKRSTFERSGSSVSAIVWARLIDPYVIRGRLLGASELWAGTAEALAEAGNFPVAQGTLHLDAALEFEWRLDKPLTETQSSSVQLTIESPQGTARGWVSVERILRLEPNKRELLSLVAQIETGDETIEDMQALIGFLTSDAAHLMASQVEEPPAGTPARCAAPSRLGEGAESADTARGMSREEFDTAAKFAVDSALTWSPSRRLLEAFGHAGPSWAVIGEVLDALRGRIGHPSGPNAPDIDSSSGTRSKIRSEKPEETSKQAEQADRTGTQLLSKLEADIERRIAALTQNLLHGDPAALTPVTGLAVARHLWILVHTGMRLCAVHLRDDEVTEEFARRFLHRAAESHRARKGVHLLDEAVAGVTAVVALNCMLPGRPAGELSELNACLETCFGVDRDRKSLEESAVRWLDCDLGQSLLGSRAIDEARVALRMTLDEPTPRALVSEALNGGVAVLEQEPYRSWHPRRRNLLFKALRDAGANQRPERRLLDPERGFFHMGCYADLRTGRDQDGRRVLDRDFAADMARWRLAACPTCSRVLAWLTP